MVRVVAVLTLVMVVVVMHVDIWLERLCAIPGGVAAVNPRVCGGTLM